MLNERQKLLIEKNISGTLTTEEKQELEEYQQDPTFQKELEFHNDLRQAIRLEYRDAFRDTLQELRKQIVIDDQPLPTEPSEKKITIEKKIDNSGTKARSIRPLWLPLVAALLVLAVPLVFIFLLDSSYSTIEPLAWAGPTKGEGNLEYTEAFEAYEQQEYENAKALFREIPEGEKDEEVLLYNAVTLLLLNQEEANEEELSQGIEYLKRVISGSDSNYREAAEWYLALAHLAQGNTEEAKELLHQIVGTQHLYAEEAEEKLDQLN